MINNTKILYTLIIALVACLGLQGCGGGGGRSPVDSTGSASLTINWASGRTVSEIQSVVITILDGSTTLAQKTSNRPLTGDVSVESFTNLQPGHFVVSVVAYSAADGTGTVLRKAYSEIVIVRGQTSTITFAASGTIDHVVVTAPVASLRPGQSVDLIASPMTAAGEIVMIPPGDITWNSSAESIATVDENGTVTAVAAGNTDITATETNSRQNGSVNISVIGSKWTVMVYMAADNNLETYGIKDFNELETVGSSDDISVVVQMDRSSFYDSSNGNWTGARRYYVTKDSNTNNISSQLLQDLGTTNMSNPQTLKNFIQFATTSYPSEHYLLVIWDHGRGWIGKSLAIPREVKAICIDDSANDEMSLPELETALTQSQHSDILLFDACLMGMLEVAYSVRNCADIMVASEENVPVQGQPYGSIMNRLASNPNITAESLSGHIVDDYITNYVDGGYSGTYTMSALNLNVLDSVVAAADQLALAINANMEMVRGGVEDAQMSAQRYDFDNGTYDEYRDLYDFARLVKQNIANQEVKAAAQSVMSAVNAVVIHESHAGSQVSNSHGISIYLPYPHQSLKAYANTQFAAATHWDEMVSAY